MKTISSKGFKKIFDEQQFENLVAELWAYRRSEFIKKLRKRKGKGLILPFVMGLRLSSKLIYIVRNLLDGTGMTANWGHILDESGTELSLECDIIVHKAGVLRQWNDNPKPVLDFNFIEASKAKAVISCKSLIRPDLVDAKYTNEMRSYVDNVWLFAEYCKTNSVDNIKETAHKCGYDKFWYLYSESKDIIDKPAQLWHDFIDTIRKMET